MASATPSPAPASSDPPLQPDRAAVRRARARLRAANEGGDRAPRPSDYRRPAPELGAPRRGAVAVALMRLTDDRALFGIFWLVLALAGAVLWLDFRGMSAFAPPAPGSSPALVRPILPPTIELPRIGPVRVPGSGSPPPNPVRTDPDVLREPLTINLAPGGTLVLRGAIDIGSSARLAAELEARGEYVAMVDLDSPGGSVQDALEMSVMLRERGVPVRVAEGSLCASSCPLVLAGGAVREVSALGSVGVHQIFAADPSSPQSLGAEGMARAQETTARIGRHLEAMGVDAALWLHAMETPKERLYYLTPDELIGYELATVILDAGDAPKIGDAEDATAD